MQNVRLNMQLRCANKIVKRRLLSLQIVYLLLPSLLFHLFVAVDTPMRKILLQGDSIY